MVLRADHVAIIALSRILNITIVIIRSDGAEPNIFKRPNSKGIAYLGFEEELHYGSLYRRLDWVPNKLIDPNINTATEDDFDDSLLKRKSDVSSVDDYSSESKNEKNQPTKLSRFQQAFFAGDNLLSEKEPEPIIGSELTPQH